MEVPEVRCEQCLEQLVLEARVVTEHAGARSWPGQGDTIVLEPIRRVIFTAEKCRCPDPVGS